MKVFSLQINGRKVDGAFTSTELEIEISRIRKRMERQEIISIEIQRFG